MKLKSFKGFIYSECLDPVSLKRLQQRQRERFFRRRMREIGSSIRAVGLDPYARLVGYLRTGDDSYITQYENAKMKIRFLEREDVHQFMQKNLHQGELDSPWAPEAI